MAKPVPPPLPQGRRERRQEKTRCEQTYLPPLGRWADYSIALGRAKRGKAPDRLLRRNQDGQDARYAPPLRLLDHHQIDVEADLGRFGAGVPDRELRGGVDLRHAPADRNDPEFLSIGLDV